MNKGATLKRLIKKSKFTQRKLAEELGTTEGYFGILLKDANLASETIERVCEIIGIDPSEHFAPSHSNVNELQEEYGKLKEKYLSEKEGLLSEKGDLLNQIQNLIKENQELRQENKELRNK